MYDYKVKFTSQHIGGRTQETKVTAMSQAEAERHVKAIYSDAKNVQARQQR